MKIVSNVTLGLLAAALLLLSCASGIGGPDLAGSIFSDVTRSESVPNGMGPKEGQSCQSAFLNIAAWGDASIEGAAKAGGLTAVRSVSFRRMHVLGSVFAKNCTLVTGE